MTAVRSCLIPACPGRRELEPDAYACPDCQQRLVRQLGEIESYLDIVTAVPSRSGDFGPRRPGYASTPPLRLDVVAMLDRRTVVNGDGPDDVIDEVPNVWADLTGWARMVYEENPDHPHVSDQWEAAFDPSAHLVAWTALARAHIGWIATRPWVDEFAADISRVHAALRTACGDAPPKSLGRCLDPGCGGEVFRRSDDPHDGRLRCGTCRTTYSGLDLVRIRSGS